LLCFALLPPAASAEGYKPSGAAPKEAIYIFGVHPYTNPQELYAAYEPVMRYLEQKVPGVLFEVEASKDYKDYEEKLAARRFAFSLPNPAQTLVSLRSGYHVIAKMTPDEDFRGLIVARADRAIPDAAALTGKPLCFPSATAVAGTMLPLLYLHDNGMEVGKTPVTYVGSQFSSILNAFTGDYAACGSTSRFWRIWSRDNPEKAKEMKVVWRTPSLPHNAIVARDDVPPAVARKVAEALAGMDKDPALDQTQFRADQQHFELATDATYKPVREFLLRYDRSIGLPASMKQGIQ
jgi:phosphonate transport system substrate-binding protein